jgi:hypothetical protein
VNNTSRKPLHTTRLRTWLNRSRNTRKKRVAHQQYTNIKTVNQFQRAIILSYYQNCPAKTTRSPRMVPWWKKKLSGLRAKTRKLFNIAKRTSQWDTCKETLTCYNKEIRKAEQFSWRRYCQEINDVPGNATHEDHGKTGDQQG